MNNQNYPGNQQQPFRPPTYQPPTSQPNYGYQQPAQQSPYGMQYPAGGPQQPMPKTWQTESIVVTVLSVTICCGIFSIISLILGIIGITKANGVKNKYMLGDMIGAQNDSKSAKTMVIIGSVFLVITGIISIIYIVLMVMASRGDFGDILQSQY